MGHLAHMPRDEGAGNEASDDEVKLNVEEGGMLVNPASSCEVISHLGRSTEDLFHVPSITDLHDGSTSNYETH